MDNAMVARCLSQINLDSFWRIFLFLFLSSSLSHTHSLSLSLSLSKFTFNDLDKNGAFFFMDGTIPK